MISFEHLCAALDHHSGKSSAAPPVHHEEPPAAELPEPPPVEAVADELEPAPTSDEMYEEAVGEGDLQDMAPVDDESL